MNNGTEKLSAESSYMIFNCVTWLPSF